MRECAHAHRQALTSARRSAGRPAQNRPVNAPLASVANAVPESVTLIVVEDKPSVREQTTAVLERAGYRLVPMADGQAAIDQLTGRPGPVDVLVADVVMPGVSGLELAEAIIERDPRVGLVLLSRYDENDTRRRAHQVARGCLRTGPDRVTRAARGRPQRNAGQGGELTALRLVECTVKLGGVVVQPATPDLVVGRRDATTDQNRGPWPKTRRWASSWMTTVSSASGGARISRQENASRPWREALPQRVRWSRTLTATGSTPSAAAWARSRARSRCGPGA